MAGDADDYTWAAAVVGSNNAAGYQLAGGAPVMAVGGFNGTDPSPTLEEFQNYVADGRIHYFIGGRMMTALGGRSTGGSREAADIAAVGGDPLHTDRRWSDWSSTTSAAAEEFIAGIQLAQRPSTTHPDDGFHDRHRH